MNGLKKNDIVYLQISDLGTEGEGIGKTDGFPLFVKGAIPGDEIEAGVTKLKKNYGYARLVSIVKASQDRVAADCPVFGRCGGCRLMHMSYEAQLAYKEKKVLETLIRIGGFDRDELSDKKDDILGMDKPFRYRNKAVYPVARGRDGHICAGFFAARTHEVIECDDCLIGAEENAGIIKRVLKWMEEYGVEPYDEMNRKGVIRHIFIRKAFATGELQLCLISATDIVPHLNKLLEKLGDITSVWLNVNSENTNVIFGRKTELIGGRGYIEDVLLDIKFRISPLSFYQVNPAQTHKLYGAALDYADLKGGEYVWDICCGIGTITLAAADRLRRIGRGGKVLGLEIVPEAIENAKENAELNGIDNVEFICAPAEEYLPERIKQAGENPDIIIVDPPRAGLERPAIDAILKVMPMKIVYVSCDPATLARDLRIFADGGYSIKHFRACDMFAQTSHVETVALLSKLSEAKHHIEVKVDMDELDLTSAEAKATYKEIQDWVQEKYGFHVTNLNIAQVKQIHGIIERENYNKAKSADSKQPGCPEEKVKAIEDAMRHFQMID
ncbi:MAG: 23S rRNA (uracil(1939)-C(5))-methyltransferase RlmD [Lachnospiraceae bacterium]|nr:23S rRNA (uracil(1939)-C(5))-methyltransferase RlmD [Lachnospiraceae bacterium]